MLRFKAIKPLSISIFLLVLVGCMGQFQDISNPKDRKKNTVLRVLTQGELNTLHPSELSTYPELLVGLHVHEPLLYVVPETGKIIPLAAESYSQDFNKQSITFHLRADLKWSNGQIVSAEDYAYALRYMLSKTAQSPHTTKLIHIKGGYKLLEGEVLSPNELGIQVLSPRTLKVEFDHFDLRTVMLFARPWMSPLKKINAFSDLNKKDVFDVWVGNGVYVPVRKNQNVILLRKNPYHRWANKIKVDEISVFFSSTGESSQNILSHENIHIAGHRGFSMDTDDIETLAKRQDYQSIEEKDLLTVFLRLNNKNEILSDVAIRKAIAMSIDRDLIKNSLNLTLYQPAYSMVPEGTLGYKPPLGVSFAKDRAFTELKSLNYCVNGEKEQCRKAGSLRFLYVKNAIHEKIALSMQSLFLRHLPFQSIVLQGVDQRTFDQRIIKGDFDLALDSIGALPDNPFGLLEAFLPSRASSGSFYHIGFERSLNRAFSHGNWSEVLQGVRESEGILLDSLELVPLFHVNTRRLVSKKVRGFHPNIFSEQVYSKISIQGF